MPTGRPYVDTSPPEWLQPTKVRKAKAAANPVPPGRTGTLPGQLVPPGGFIDTRVAEMVTGQSRNEVAKTQQFLKNRGYNIAVDGIMGVDTSSALNDYQSGGGKRDALAWTQRNRPVDDGRPSRGRGPNNNATVDRGKKGDPTKPDKPLTDAEAREAHDEWTRKHLDAYTLKTKAGKTRGSLSNNSGKGVDGSVYDQFDPDILAKAAMEAKYGPQMAELLRQENVTKLSGQYRKGEIKDMYGTYVKDIGNRNIDAANSRKGMLAATGDLAKSIGQGVALNADEQASLNQTGAIDTTYAAEMAQSGDDYDRRMQSAAQGGGTFAQQQAQAQADAGVHDIQSKRSDITAQRGADLVSTREQLRQWGVDNAMKQRELDANIADAGTKNAIAIANLRSANAALPIELRMKQAELDKTIAEITQTKAQTTQINKGDPTKAAFPTQFVKLSSPQKNDLQTEILKSIPEGSTTPKVVQIINARLRGLGYKPVANREVGDFAYNTAKAAGAAGVSRKYWTNKKK